MRAIRASIASSSARPALRPSSFRTTPAWAVMVSRIARCSALTFSGPSAARRSSISARAWATAAGERRGASASLAREATARPTIRPNTSSSMREFPPSRLAPCRPLAASPIA